MKKTEFIKKENFIRDFELIEDIYEYDFQNLRLSVLAQKIKSQTAYRPKPKMLYY